MFAMLHLVAPSDTSGNPRRLYALYTANDKGHTNLKYLWDEGYAGAEVVGDPFYLLAKGAAQMNITAGEYKRLKKQRGI